MGENGVGTLVCFICDEHGTYCLSTAALHTNSTRGGLFPTQPHKIEEQFKYWDLIYIISLKKNLVFPLHLKLLLTFLVKWKSCSRVWLCDPMDYTAHGFLQARILEWVAFPVSRSSSQLRDWTQVSHTAGRFFISWGTREAQNKTELVFKKQYT